MNQDRANTRNFGSLQGPQDGIAQQSRPDPLALVRFINRESANYHHGDGLWHVAADASGDFVVCNGAICQRVVSDDPIARADYVCAGGAGLLIR